MLTLTSLEADEFSNNEVKISFSFPDNQAPVIEAYSGSTTFYSGRNYWLQLSYSDPDPLDSVEINTATLADSALNEIDLYDTSSWFQKVSDSLYFISMQNIQDDQLDLDYTFFVEVIDSAETVTDSTPLTDSITINLSTK